MKSKLRKALALFGIMGLAAAPSISQALPLIPSPSQIDFVGGVDPVGGVNTYDGTGLDFLTNGAPSIGTPGSLGLSNTSSGAFTAFSTAACPNTTLGGCGTIADLLTFNPTVPLANFLTFNQGAQSVTFSLYNLTVTQVLPTGTSLGTITISGSGEVDYQGYAPTIAVMTITAQGPFNTSFSGSLVSEDLPVPEPASLALMGFAIMALGGAVYRRRTASSANAGSVSEAV